MTDKKERCPNKAKYLYSWSGELIKGCEGHAKAMIAIGDAMGITIETKHLITEENCMHDNDLDKIIQK